MVRTEQGREMYELGLRLGSGGPVAIGAAGGTLAAALARCVGCGVILSGSDARFHDGSCAACGVWLAGYYRLSAAVFIRQSGGDLSVQITDGQGRPCPPSGPEVTPPCTGQWDFLSGTDGIWAARRAVACRGNTVAAEGPQGLKLLLERMGCDVLDRPAPGVPLLRSDREGFHLTVEQGGTVIPLPGTDALDAAAMWLTRGRAVPAFGEQGLTDRKDERS